MNPDDKLAAILRMEADEVEPSAAGWDAITTGIAARRVRTRWLRGGALAGAVLTVVALLVFTTSGSDHDSLHPVTPTSTATPSADVSETPTPSPSVSPSVSASPVAPPSASAVPAFQGAAGEPTGGIWPLTTWDEVHAWQADHSKYPELATVEGAALAFARTYLGIPDATVQARGADRENMFATVLRDGREVSSLRLSGFGPYNEMLTAPFVVNYAYSPGLEIGVPDYRTLHDSPITASGSYGSVDPSLTVTLFADGAGAPVELAHTKATTYPSSSTNAWVATLEFSTTAKTGSIRVTNPSLKDGGVAEAAAIPVRFGTPPPPSKFVAARDGRIAVLSTATGAVQQWLTPAGVEAYDPRRIAGDSRVVYVERTGSCSSAIKRIAGGTVETLVTENAVLANPVWYGQEPNMRWAYERTGCGTGAKHELVLHGGTQEVTVPVDGEVLGDLGLGDTAAVAYVVLKDGVSRLHQARFDGAPADPPVAPPAGCYTWSAVTVGAPVLPNRNPTWLAAARCGSTRLYRLDPDFRNPTFVGNAAALNVTSLDWSPDGNYLVLGDHGGGVASAFLWHRGGVTQIPGVAQRPSW